MYNTPRVCDIFWPQKLTFLTLIFSNLFHVILCVGVTKETESVVKKVIFRNQRISLAGRGVLQLFSEEIEIFHQNRSKRCLQIKPAGEIYLFFKS